MLEAAGQLHNALQNKSILLCRQHAMYTQGQLQAIALIALPAVLLHTHSVYMLAKRCSVVQKKIGLWVQNVRLRVQPSTLRAPVLVASSVMGPGAAFSTPVPFPVHQSWLQRLGWGVPPKSLWLQGALWTAERPPRAAVTTAQTLHAHLPGSC